jgi:hypothetical protein
MQWVARKKTILKLMFHAMVAGVIGKFHCRNPSMPKLKKGVWILPRMGRAQSTAISIKLCIMIKPI